jgi:hypothetical protein
LFVGALLIFWVVLAWPAQRLGGDAALEYCTVAGLLCLIPGAATLMLVGWGERQQPGLLGMLMLLGSGIRMFAVLGAGLLICKVGLPGRESVDPAGFWVWVLVFYLFSLAVEAGLVVAARQSSNPAEEIRAELSDGSGPV